MEIYRNAPAARRQVSIPFPIVPTTVDIFVERPGEEDVELTSVSVVATPTGSPDTLTITLPLHLTHTDSIFDVRWEISYVEDAVTYTTVERTPVGIVTPILTDAEIRAIDANVFSDVEEIEKIEKAVRHIINAYTGQEFGLFTGTLVARGTGGTAVSTPRRLISMTHLNGIAVNSSHVSIESEGYTLRYYPRGVPPVKADYDGLHMHVGGVIHNPNDVRLTNFKTSQSYRITGQWGWETVPAAVKEAAKLLVNDYACADSQYRDRYLVSMTAADWRIQFNSGAYLRTGNVRADQLLSDFVVTRGWGII